MAAKPGASPQRAWRVPAFPVLNTSLAFKSYETPRFPFGAQNITFWLNARAALWQGLRYLGLKPGDRVLVPAYACGSEIDVLLRFGLQLDFYPISPDLEIDFKRAELLCGTNTKAFFVIHYFGFSQPLNKILEFVRERDMYIIEDNAHGLYSSAPNQQPLGSVGDISIFSLYKSLPLPSGGALVINRSTGSETPILRGGRPPASLDTLGKFRQLSERTAARKYPQMTSRLSEHVLSPLASALKTMGRRDKSNPAPDPLGDPWDDATQENFESAPAFDLHTGEQGIPRISRWLLGRVNHSDVLARRRENYERLLARIEPGQHARALFPSLPAGCCPLFFPLLQISGGRGLRSLLHERGIECHGFGFNHAEIPLARFPLEAELKDKVACLPIHQDLAPHEIDEMADIINFWNRGEGFSPPIGL